MFFFKYGNYQTALLTPLNTTNIVGEAKQIVSTILSSFYVY